MIPPRQIYLTLLQLFPFLRDKNPQVRQIALTNLLGHTPKNSSNRDIFFTDLRGGGLQGKQDNDVIRDLKLLCRDQLVWSTKYRWFTGTYYDARLPLMTPSELS